MAQETSKRKGKKTGKLASKKTETQAPSPQGEDLLAAEGTEPEELGPYMAELLVSGGPSREELSQGQKTCPSLESLSQQAAAQEKGDISSFKRTYWEEGLLYSEARDPKPAATRRMVVSQMYRVLTHFSP